MALLFWLTGLRASEVFAYMSGAGAPVEMYDAVVAKFDNGSIGDHFSRRHPTLQQAQARDGTSASTAARGS